QLEDSTYKYLTESYYKESQGLPITPHADPRVQEIAEAYRKSGFARNSLKRQADSGMDVQGIRESDNYVPVHWDHHKVVRFTKNEDASIADVARAFGDQIAGQFPNLVRVAKLSPEQIGRSF